MPKTDLKKELGQLYGASSKTAAVVNVPELRFLMVDGTGDPNTSDEYREAVEALFSLSYALKFKIKKADPADDFVVMPLEGLWWVEDMSRFNMDDKSGWQWTMMILQPELVTDGLLIDVFDVVQKKKELPALTKVRLKRALEGLCAQILHVGPYSAEGPTVAGLHAFIEREGYSRRGKHHEIYLGDPRRTNPEKLRTIIRQPIE